MVSSLLFVPCVVLPIAALMAVSRLAVLWVHYHVQKDKVGLLLREVMQSIHE